MSIEKADVVGNKAIVEASGKAVQLNGRPYNNLYVVLSLSRQLGELVEVVSGELEVDDRCLRVVSRADAD